MKYDQLVLAVGTNANLNLVKGMGDYALPLKTLGDALFLRNRVISRLEQAELQPVREHRRWLTTFVIVGGGFSGVETAGELVDFLHASLRYYRNIDRDDIRIVLLHSGDRLMPELSAPLGAFTLRKMMKHDVEVRLNARAVRVTDRAVILDNGDIIEGGTVVCTIGTQPNPLLDDIPAPKERGRLTVNDDFSVPGVDGVWAAGDCAAVQECTRRQSPRRPRRSSPRPRRIAWRATSSRKLAGQPTVPFSYSPKGQMASIGHNKAVAEVFGIRFPGSSPG